MEETEIMPEMNTVSFADVLKEAREKRGLTVDDVVAETCISKQVVEQMEIPGSSRLPEPVFLRGFIKSYAELVGLDPEAVIDIYKKEFGIEDKPVRDIRDNVSSSSMQKAEHRYMMPIVLIGIVLIILAGALYSYKTGTVDDPGNGQGTAGEKAVTSETGNKNTGSAVKGYKLEVICVEETTLKISADGENVSEYKMAPEDHLALEAKNGFNILINNTCGVTLFLNDNPVEIPGKCGQTVNIHLPR